MDKKGCIFLFVSIPAISPGTSRSLFGVTLMNGPRIDSVGDMMLNE